MRYFQFQMFLKIWRYVLNYKGVHFFVQIIWLSEEVIHLCELCLHFRSEYLDVPLVISAN